MSNEIWKNIDAEGRYSVSNLGRVRRNQFTTKIFKKGLKTYPEKILPQYDLASKRSDKGTDAYKIVLLTINGKQKRYYVHRLVAEAFVFNDDIEKKTVVDHIDNSCSNNKADNLRWVTNTENIVKGKNLKKMKNENAKL